MTVKELIERLQEIGSEAEVFYSLNDDDYDFKKIKEITIDFEGDVIIK